MPGLQNPSSSQHQYRVTLITHRKTRSTRVAVTGSSAKCRAAAKTRRERATTRKASEAQTRPTTLDEYIEACHTFLSSHLTVETDIKLTAKSPITIPSDNRYPKSLKPWHGFQDQQKLALVTLYESFPAEHRAFENENFLAILGNQIARRPIADEKSLESHLHDSAGVPDWRWCHLENYPHALNDIGKKAVEGRHGQQHRGRWTSAEFSASCRWIKSVSQSDDRLSSRRTMLYIPEYKPPHKWAPQHLRADKEARVVQDVEASRADQVPWLVHPGFPTHLQGLRDTKIMSPYALPRSVDDGDGGGDGGGE
ncbi:hypothetical protein FCOIX_5561 [Fusarium coicis]|nr:hypothetical protein FCOIX_5561 [Fusarium coicis]